MAGEQLRVHAGTTPGCAFATTQLQLLLVEPLRQVRASHPTVQILVVVGDLSLQRCGHHERVAQELDRASKCLATKLIQAQCDVAINKSKVLSNSRSVRARWQARLTPLGGAGFQGEAEPWHRFHSRTAGLHGCAAGAVGNIQRVCQANQEDPLEIVSPSAATAVATARPHQCAFEEP